jgi:hypothetical protein
MDKLNDEMTILRGRAILHIDYLIKTDTEESKREACKHINASAIAGLIAEDEYMEYIKKLGKELTVTFY